MKPFCSLTFRLPVGAAAVVLAAWLGRPYSASAQTFDLIPLAGTVWRFDDSATDLGTAWREATFPDEANWRTGTGLFGVEPTVPYPYPAAVSTPLVLGANRITYYFRTRFPLTNVPSSLVVQGTAYVDDGAVFYLNGLEVGRVRVAEQPVVHTSKAQLSYPEGLAYSWTIPSSALVTGDNVMAVEVHQNSSSSSDVVFGLGLQATVAVPPSIVNLNQPADRVVPQGQPTTLTVIGEGIPAPAYQWYHDGVPVAGANAASLHIPSFMAADAGQYYVVLTNIVGVATSRVAQVQFQADTTPPSVLYAIGRDAVTVQVVFSEALEPFGATDSVNWSLETAEGAVPLDIIQITIQNGTNLFFTTQQARVAGTAYVVRTLEFISDLFGNLMPPGVRVPIAAFPTPLMTLSGQTWRYDASGADPGPGWAAAAFNDAGWATGLGVFDAFRALPDSAAPHCQRLNMMLPGGETVGTCLQTLSNAQNTAQYSAAYFRTHFNFTGNATNTVLQLRALLDDGAVVYLNGVELFRPGMAAGTVVNSTLAGRTVGNPVWETFEFASSALVEGDNVLAVEVHQESLSSPDLTFGLELTGVLPAPAPQQRADAAPRLQAATGAGTFNVSWLPPGGRLQFASESAGPWVDVAAAQPGRHLDPMTAGRRFFRVVVP